MRPDVEGADVKQGFPELPIRLRIFGVGEVTLVLLESIVEICLGCSYGIAPVLRPTH